MAWVWDLACKIMATSLATNWSQEISWNFGLWETRWGSKWLWDHSCVFLIVDSCFANIPYLSLHFFDLLCHLDFFAEESESEEEVTNDSPRGSPDDWSDDTSDMSRCWCFCSGNMNQGSTGFHFLDGELDLPIGWLSLSDPFACVSSNWFKNISTASMSACWSHD